MLLNDFYTIGSLTREGQSIQAELHLNPHHAIHQGHFPDNPVVPGVCMMTMVKEVMERELGVSLVLKEAKSVKFLGVVNPHKQTVLHVRCEVAREGDAFKTNCVVTAGELVCYKAGAVYSAVEPD